MFDSPGIERKTSTSGALLPVLSISFPDIAPRFGIRKLTDASRESIRWARWQPVRLPEPLFGEGVGVYAGFRMTAGSGAGRVRLVYLSGIRSRKGEVLQPPALHVRGASTGPVRIEEIVNEPARLTRAAVIGRSIKFSGVIPVSGNTYRELWIQPDTEVQGQYAFALSEKGIGIRERPRRLGMRTSVSISMFNLPDEAFDFDEEEMTITIPDNFRPHLRTGTQPATVHSLL